VWVRVVASVKRSGQIEGGVKSANADRKQAEANVVALNAEVTRLRHLRQKEVRKVASERNREITEMSRRRLREVEGLLEELRRKDKARLRLTREKDELLKKISQSQRDRAIEQSRSKNPRASHWEPAALLRVRAANPKRCVSVSFDKTPFRRALATLTQDTSVRHLVTASALEGAKAKVVSLIQRRMQSREPPSLAISWIGSTLVGHVPARLVLRRACNVLLQVATDPTTGDTWSNPTTEA